MSTLTPEAKKKLAHTIRAVREQLLRTLDDEAKRTYRLAVPIGKAGLDEAPRRRRERLEAWIEERVRTTKPKNAKERDAARERLLAQAVKEAAATLVNRLVLRRHLEALGLSTPAVVTGGWSSRAYQQLGDFAPGLLTDLGALEAALDQRSLLDRHRSRLLRS